MFEELRIINERLYVRTKPNGKWHETKGSLSMAGAVMAMLRDDERKRLLSCFCHKCGCIQGEHRCNC